MVETAIRNEPALRVAVFVGVFALVAGWEAVWPRRSQRFARRVRWPHNLGLLAFDVLLLRVFAPGAAIAVALAAEAHGWALLNDAALLQPFRGMQDLRPDPALQCPATPGSTADGPHAATECGGQT